MIHLLHVVALPHYILELLPELSRDVRLIIITRREWFGYALLSMGKRKPSVELHNRRTHNNKKRKHNAAQKDNDRAPLYMWPHNPYVDATKFCFNALSVVACSIINWFNIYIYIQQVIHCIIFVFSFRKVHMSIYQSDTIIYGTSRMRTKDIYIYIVGVKSARLFPTLGGY